MTVTQQQPAAVPSVSIPGLTSLPDYIDQAQHDRLVVIIDEQPWINELQRRVQHYGYRYDYKARKVESGMYLGPLPDWAQELAGRLHADGCFPVCADQLIVNEYQPGQGISKHVDCVPCFDNVIASLSLGSTCVIEFVHTKTRAKQTLLLEPRSLVLLRDEARYKWTHAVPARKSDRIGGRTLSRSRRLSLTFRKVLPARD
jgi:alkylated DNA repair dioxygenase AlkB